MGIGSEHREVTVERSPSGDLVVTNTRGGRLIIGGGENTYFSPTELLLGAIGGCTAADVDVVTTRRAEPTAFQVHVQATKMRDTAGNRLTDIQVTFRIAFPEGEHGDRARAVLPDIVRRSHDWLCTVSRTVELGTPITTRIE